MPHALLDDLRAARVVPVVRTLDARHAATAVQWLRDADLRIFEITMTIPDAPALIRELAADPTLLVGTALAAGADAVKIFPASSAGGPGHIRALGSVFPGAPFRPTGGVAPANVAAYLAAGDRAAIEAAAHQVLAIA